MTETIRPKDALFKATYSNKLVMAGTLEALLPPQLCARIDMDSLEVQSGEFIDVKLKDSHSDLLVKALIAGKPLNGGIVRTPESGFQTTNVEKP